MADNERDRLARELAALSCMRRSGEKPATLRRRDADIARLEERIKALDEAAEEPCDTCDGSGVIVAMDSPEGIQRCDTCNIYPGDLEAALVAAQRVSPNAVVRFHGADGKVHTFTGEPFEGLIEDQTNPWVEVDGTPVDWMTRKN